MKKLPTALANCALAATIFVASMATPVLHAQANLPQLGDGEQMSVAAERRLGTRIAREIYRDPDYLDDPLISDYVQRIWQPLLQAARTRGDITAEQDARFAWEVMLARDRTVNAFALPGGYLGVHLGLIAMVGNRDELASVLAHELSHVTQRHIARMTSKQNQQAPLILAAMILGALAASKNSEAASAVIAGSQAAGAQARLNFSRDMEREADRIGYQVLQDAGFAVQGFVGMFDKLAVANRINDNGSFPYLRTHPLTSERIGDMQARLQLGAGATASAAASSTATSANASTPSPQALATEHAIIATRARLLANPAADLLRAELAQARLAWSASQNLAAPSSAPASTPAPIKSAASTDKMVAQLYGGAWAAWRLRDLDLAAQLAQRAADVLKTTFNNPLTNAEYAQTAIDLVASDIALAQGSSSRARSKLEPYVQAKPLRRPVLLQWVQVAAAQAAAGQSAAAQTPTVQNTASQNPATPADLTQLADRLQNWVADRPRDALAWDALASIYTAQGLRLRAVRAQAEARVALLDYSAALDRFKAGQELAKTAAGSDHFEASIIDARTRTVQAQLRELESEKLLGQ